MAEFNPFAAAATYVGAKAKENPACSDADRKLLESIDGHGSEANFQSLGKAIDAAGDTVEKLDDQIEDGRVRAGGTSRRRPRRSTPRRRTRASDEGSARARS